MAAESRDAASVSLRDALVERWFDVDDDHHEITDEQILKRLEDIVGEGWHVAGSESERLTGERDGALRELRRVESIRANSERVAHKALALAEEVYGWAVHEPNHHRLLGRLAELREELTRGA